MTWQGFKGRQAPSLPSSHSSCWALGTQGLRGSLPWDLPSPRRQLHLLSTMLPFLAAASSFLRYLSLLSETIDRLRFATLYGEKLQVRVRGHGSRQGGRRPPRGQLPTVRPGRGHSREPGGIEGTGGFGLPTPIPAAGQSVEVLGIVTPRTLVFPATPVSRTCNTPGGSRDSEPRVRRAG